MQQQLKPRTAAINGRLWGMRARDWAEVAEAVQRPFYDALFDRIGLGSGLAYLDIGCGAGLAPQMARARGATVHGLDASEPLLAIARERTPEGEFQAGDMEELPYADRSFDIVTGINSFQYAGNPQVALGEAGRVAKPDGVVVMVTWGDPEGMEAANVLGALRPLLPPPPPGTPGPFALSEEATLRQFATGAGLRPVEVFDIDFPFQFTDEPTALRGLRSAGISAKVIEEVGEAPVDEAHAKAIAPYHQEDGSYRFGASFRCLVARP